MFAMRLATSSGWVEQRRPKRRYEWVCYWGCWVHPCQRRCDCRPRGKGEASVVACLTQTYSPPTNFGLRSHLRAGVQDRPIWVQDSARVTMSSMADAVVLFDVDGAGVLLLASVRVPINGPGV